MEAHERKKPGRKATGLKNDLNINFRWDQKGLKLIQKRAKIHGMSFAAYMRYAVDQETQ